jgi:thioredoxin reductase
METYDYVVIGGGVAGLGALEALPAEHSAVLLEGRRHLMHTLTWMKTVPLGADGMTGVAYRASLLDAAYELEKAGRIRTEARVFRVDKDRRVVHVRSAAGSHEEVGYRTLVVAVGATQILYGRYLLPGIRGGRFFTAYQVGEMLEHYEFLPGRELVIFGESTYALETAAAARAQGLNATLVSPAGLPHPPASLEDVPVYTNVRLKQVYGGKRFEGLLLQHGGRELAVAGDALVVDGDFVLEHEWRTHLGVEWDLSAWRLALDEREMQRRKLVFVGDAACPTPDFAAQYRAARDRVDAVLNAQEAPA